MSPLLREISPRRCGTPFVSYGNECRSVLCRAYLLHVKSYSFRTLSLVGNCLSSVCCLKYAQYVKRNLPLLTPENTQDINTSARLLLLLD
jgi:hypothetical protein